MARTYAQVKVSIWQDDDFRALSVDAQHLYFLLLTSPTLNLAGVHDWRPKRIATLTKGLTPAAVDKAAVELQRQRYVIIDTDTEEVLVRTLIRHDNILRGALTAAGMVSGWTSTYSIRLRAAIADEVRKLAREGLTEGVLKRIAPVLEYVPDTPTKGVSEGASEGALEGASDQPQPQPQPAALQPSELRPDVESLLDHLDGCIKANGAKVPGRTRANIDAARLLIERDGRDVDEILAVIDWATSDEFWRTNILSMSKLRAQYDQLNLKRTTQPRPRFTRQQETDDLFAAAARRMGVTPQPLHNHLTIEGTVA